MRGAQAHFVAPKSNFPTILSEVDAWLLEADGKMCSKVLLGTRGILLLDWILAKFTQPLQADYDPGSADPKF